MSEELNGLEEQKEEPVKLGDPGSQLDLLFQFLDEVHEEALPYLKPGQGDALKVELKDVGDIIKASVEALADVPEEERADAEELLKQSIEGRIAVMALGLERVRAHGHRHAVRAQIIARLKQLAREAAENALPGAGWLFTLLDEVLGNAKVLQK